MTVSSDTEADIARLFHVEHWKVGTIATQLGVHEDVVRRVIVEKKQETAVVAPQLSPLVTPYQGLIKENLARYPRLCASRLFDMMVDRGYSGSMRTLRRYVMEVRPKKSREALSSP